MLGFYGLFITTVPHNTILSLVQFQCNLSGIIGIIKLLSHSKYTFIEYSIEQKYEPAAQ